MAQRIEPELFELAYLDRETKWCLGKSRSWFLIGATLLPGQVVGVKERELMAEPSHRSHLPGYVGQLCSNQVAQ